MPTNPYSSYLEAAVLTAEPVELVCMLYRAALDAVSNSRSYLASDQIAERAEAISKAMDILRELTFTLNHDSEPAMARNLTELYDYMQRTLLAANIELSDKKLAEVSGLLANLVQAWETVNSQQPRKS
jgi:flagellar protein FliS